MADVSISRGITVKSLSFLGKKENNADNKSSDDKRMKTSTKMMIGASALAIIVVGGILVSKSLKKGKIPQEIGELKPSGLSGKPTPRTASELVQEANEVKPSLIEETPVADKVKQEIKQQPKTEIIQEKVNVQEVASETNEVISPVEEKVETVVESKVQEIKHNYIEDNKKIASYLKDGEPVEESLTRYILDRDKNSLENSFTLENSYLKRFMEEGNEIKYVINNETGAIEIKCGEHSFPSREFERMSDGKIERLDLGDRDIDMLERNLGELAENQIREGEYIAEELNNIKEDKEYLLNRIAEYVRNIGGFKKCNKTISYTDGYGNREPIRIIYEGVGCDITEDGRLLQKVVLCENEKQYVNILDRIKQHAEECAREYVCSVY